MRDIRMFMRDNKLFVYDRASARLGNRTPVVVLEKPNGEYYMSKGMLDGSYVRNTDRLEAEIYKKMSEKHDAIPVSPDRVASEMEDFLKANSDQIGVALSVIDRTPEGNVERIMKEVLNLSPKERAELLGAILDIL